MRRMIFCLGFIAAAGGCLPALAADSQLPHWSGKLAAKTKPASVAAPADEKKDAKPAADAKASPKKASEQAPSKPAAPREPEWLRNMDKNDRATLKGGWGLQNISGGKQSLTTAGDRSGQYAPNTYQGVQFQRWNNVSNRRDVPSWNGTSPRYPSGMWSQGYTSPNTYYGAGAQRWGNMSSGGMTPNSVSGGWSMSPWP